MKKQIRILMAILLGLAWTAETSLANENPTNAVTCELLLPVTTWKIPDPASSNKLEIAVALQIRNNTTETFLFSRFDTIWPLLQAKSGTKIELQRGRDATRKPVLADYRMLRPGESTTFTVKAALYWQNNRLMLGGSDGFGGGWSFCGLAEGEYEFGFSYAYTRAHDVPIQGYPDGVKMWKGVITSSLVQVVLESAAARPGSR